MSMVLAGSFLVSAEAMFCVLLPAAASLLDLLSPDLAAVFGCSVLCFVCCSGTGSLRRGTFSAFGTRSSGRKSVNRPRVWPPPFEQAGEFALKHMRSTTVARGDSPILELASRTHFTASLTATAPLIVALT